MARNKRIASVSLDGLRPLGTPEQRSWELLVRALNEALGADYQVLFAEPVPSPKGDFIDWYVETAEPPVALDRLDDEAQAQTTERLGEMIGAILEHASTLEASKDQETKRLGAALRNATEIPGENFIYAAGKQPVIICWSYHRTTSQAPRGVLSAMTPVRPEPVARPSGDALSGITTTVPPIAAAAGGGTTSGDASPATATPVRKREYGWLWWLLWLFIGLTTAAILYLMIVACGISSVGFFNFCSVAQAAPSLLRNNRGPVLRQELTMLQREIGARALQCVSTRGGSDEFSRRVKAQGGGVTGDLRVTLIWNTPSDVDLAVVCPGGSRIWAWNREACGGMLNIDANQSDPGAPIMEHPVENVIFNATPEPGTYSVIVTLFNSRINGRKNRFRVEVEKETGPVYFDGSLSKTETSLTYTFEFP